MSKHIHYTLRSGESLIETVIALAVITMLVMGIVVASTTSLYTSGKSGTRALAVKYAQDGLEKARQVRDADWAAFVTYAGLTACVDEAGIVYPCPSPSPGTEKYSRTIIFTYDAPTETMTATSTVSWLENGQTRSVQLTTYLTKWK